MPEAACHHGGHEAGAEVDEKLRQSDKQGFLDDFSFGSHDAPVEMDHVVLVAEQMYLPAEHAELGEDGGSCCSADAPSEHEDEHRGQNAVEYHRSDGGAHGLLRTIG